MRLLFSAVSLIMLLPSRWSKPSLASLGVDQLQPLPKRLGSDPLVLLVEGLTRRSFPLGSALSPVLKNEATKKRSSLLNPTAEYLAFDFQMISAQSLVSANLHGKEKRACLEIVGPGRSARTHASKVLPTPHGPSSGWKVEPLLPSPASLIFKLQTIMRRSECSRKIPPLAYSSSGRGVRQVQGETVSHTLSVKATQCRARID